MFIKIWGIYTLYSLVCVVCNGRSVSKWFIGKFSWSEIRQLLFYNRSRVIWDESFKYDFMWYFLAVIYVYIVVYIVLTVWKKYRKQISFFSFLVLLGVSAFTCFQNVEMTYYRNWLLLGLPCFLVGNYFYGLRFKTKYSFVIGVLMIVFGELCACWEGWFFQSQKDIYFGSILAIIGVLICAKNRNTRQNYNQILIRIGEKISSKVYCWHVLVATVLLSVMRRVVVNKIIYIIFPILVYCATVLVVELIDFLRDKIYKTKSNSSHF